MKQQLKTIFSRDHPLMTNMGKKPKAKRCADCKRWQNRQCRIINAVGPCPVTKEYYCRKPFLWIFPRFWRLK